MRRTLFYVLFGVLLIGALSLSASSASPALAAPHVSVSIPGCADNDYSCGFLHGFADGRTAEQLGLCKQKSFHAKKQLTSSEQGYQDGFTRYCPA